jgi:predicted nucleotidyltransferase
MYYDVMNTVKLEEIKTKVLPILKQADVKKAAIFGSYASGTDIKTSDIDILVELPENATLFELGGLKVTLEEKLNKNVDIVTYKSISPIIKDSILSNQYPLI